jgi:pSer/pThr/pTyr-binding forkhead associated (FHA) protein
VAKLVVTRSGAVSRYPADAQVGKEFPLPLHAVIVGSGESCAVRIDIDSVSPRHARIYFNGDAWIVEDLQSPNGCSVNDMRVATSVLRDSDALRVGGFTFKFLAAGTFEIPNSNDEGEGGTGAPAELRIRLPKPSN